MLCTKNPGKCVTRYEIKRSWNCNLLLQVDRIMANIVITIHMYIFIIVVCCLRVFHLLNVNSVLRFSQNVPLKTLHSQIDSLNKLKGYPRNCLINQFCFSNYYSKCLKLYFSTVAIHIINILSLQNHRVIEVNN